jgi:uncharacterized protein YjbI with pentapeptide repeats
MNLESGLSVKKPVSAWNKPLKVNFKDLFKALGSAGSDVATQNWVGVGKDAVDAIAAVGLTSKDPAELAWSLIYNSLTKAIYRLVGESQYLMTDVPSDIDPLIESLDWSFENKDLEITDDFFKHPEQLSLVKDIQLPLRQWFEGVGVSAPQAEALSNRLPSYFTFSLEDEWRRHSQDYEPITARVKTPFTEADGRARGWRLYNAWLQKEIKEPMMLEAFGLDDVYVPLRAYFKQKREKEKGEAEESGEALAITGRHGERGQYERVVVDLEAVLNTWLRADEKNDAIRVISGGPGSGKSSFAKIFAAHHAFKGSFPVLFIPLHQFDPTGDLIKAIGEFIRYDEYIKENPVDPENDDLKLLIIFDGLDELAMQGKLAKEVAQEFVREVQDKVSQFNRRKTRLQVVITGREVAVQDSCKDPCQMLHVFPYFVPEDERKQENDEPYLDSARLLACDQRNEWWQKYGAATQREFDAMPSELDHGSLTEITAQPLLNYLVALSYVQGKLTLSETTSLNTIYADLLDAVYERGYEGKNRRHAAIGDMTKDQFIRILEEIALAAWHGNGRTTTVKEIEEHCNNSGLKQLLDIFEEGAKAGVTRLLAAFYFRKSGERNSEHTFEFTHKSFGEYLTALRIVRAMERIQKQLDKRKGDMEEGWDEKQALLHWAEVCGPTRMDAYLLNFLSDEVALKNAEEAAKLQKTFGHLIGVMLRQGMPMEKIESPLNKFSFYTANQWAINAEESLLAALTVCARVTKELSKVDWPTPEAFGTWIRRLQGQRTGVKNVVALLSLSLLDLSETVLDFLDFYGANLERANLEGADLYGVTFGRASLYGANLKGASLERTNLEGANLERANLKGASLERTNFYGANLERANLEGADLEQANLEGADLERANLKGASLERTNFYGANLERAHLEGVNLKRADLRTANLELANLEGANLEGANLEESNLEDANLEDANLEEANFKDTIYG